MAEVPPLGDHEYVYGLVPPDAVTVLEPFVPALQLTLVVALMFEVNAVGSVIVAMLILVQLFASVTVTV